MTIIVRQRTTEYRCTSPPMDGMEGLDLALLSIKPKKAPGPDSVTDDMLGHIGPAAKKKIQAIFNQSCHLSHVSSRWKEAVFKKGKDKKKTDNYRPISLLICPARY